MELRRRLISGIGRALGLKSIAFDPIDVGWYIRNGYPQIAAILGAGVPSWSDEPVNLRTALNHSAVWACNRIISESIGYIPASLMQRRGETKRLAEEHPMHSAMHNAPNDEITAQGFSEMLTSHCLLSGNGYAQIIRRSGTGTAIELRPLLPAGVFPDREKTGQKRLVYVVKASGEQDKTYTVIPGKPQDILHLRGLGWDGIQGFSVIELGRQSIGSAIASEHNVARFWANGGRVAYHLELAQKFKSEQDAEKFRADWQKIYSDPHLAPILEPWLKYVQDGLSMVDAQALETRQFNVSEICRWFNVSPHLVQDLSKATFSNIEHLFLQFKTLTLSTWLSRWEQDFWRCVLTPEEKSQGYFLKHNVNALLRGDFKSRMEGYSIMLQNGIASQNEVRDLEDWDPFDGGDGHHIQLNMQMLPGDPASPLPAQLVKLDKNAAA